ncbi:hypothetical protein KIW84_071055 [Lathyrus oleraceus]|uniref:Uncharacterized protein n=1 Tax=Pisum sativum TaxID=3888 RepID=A0A9D4VHB5_PEA|nr:hypothetical protein KIW84_071055 [Pisum sativum]
MVQLCFVLDLRTLAPPLLPDLKQSLLQLANFYAISSSSSSSSSSARKSATLSDRIGLCYVVKNRFTSSDELIIAYRPVGDFNLRDFHHAVNSLPSDAYLFDMDNISDVMISDVLSDRVLYSWQGKDIERKVIVITSILPEDVGSVMQKSLMDAADKCVSVDFAVFQLKSSHLIDSRENINNFRRSISHLDNCSVQTYITGDAEKKLNMFSCPVTGSNLETIDVNENSVLVGEKTILFLPSFHNSLKLMPVYSPITVTVTERINLASLDEGLIMGASFVVTASSYHVIETNSDDTDQSDMNAQLFQGLASVLHSMDQGLICSSNCDLETMTEAPYHCYYILQPSDNGPMLMRIDVTDYDPLLHERGFHQKLNVLVKESLQLGSVFPKKDGAFSELSSSQQPSSEVIGRAKSANNVVVVDEEILSMDITDQDDRTMANITEEWKQLVVSEEPKLYSPSCLPKAKLDQSSIAPRNGNRQLDKETSRILERLEVPRPLKGKKASPVSNESCVKNKTVPTKKPLIPFQPSQNTEQVIVGSQLLKPNFQRQKRKQR